MAAISPPVTASPTAGPVPQKSRRHRILDRLYPYGYIAPSIVFMVIASFFPIVFTIMIAFTNYGNGHFVNNLPFSSSGSAVAQWVGWSNFQHIFTIDLPDFIPVFVWTVVFAAVSTVINFVGGLVLAYLLNNENMWERNFYRTILIIPWALPGVIAILAWGNGILQPGGLMDSLMSTLHLPQIAWLADPNWARFWVIVVNFWLGFPFMMTACLGALQSISPEVMQAAEIDGANGLQKFVRVTLPLLRSATLPLLIATFAYNMNNFGIVYLLTIGGPLVNFARGATDILPTFIYNQATGAEPFYGLACAYGVIVFIIIGGLSSINMKLSGAFEQVD
jgi:arabinogalactan oligomer/maltooligosaccharide transport system permease protein